MNRRVWTVAALAALVAVGIVGGAVLAAGRPSVVAGPSADPSTGLSLPGSPERSASAPFSPQHSGAAATQPGSGPGASPTAPGPAPFIQDFGGGGTPRPPQASPTAPVAVAIQVDGCDHGYGAPQQCVPWEFPPSVTDKCAWLAANGFHQLTVHGPDRHGLDPDRDGIAC